MLKKTGRLRFLTLGVSLLVVLAWGRPLVADLDAPRAEDSSIAYIVTMQLRSKHLSRHPLDDEISQRGFELFFKTLDPNKTYFTKADIDEFSGKSKQLDDMVRKGDIAFAYDVYKRFLQRLDERVKLVDEFLDGPQDFTIDEEFQVDRRKAAYAASADEVRELWRKRVKLDLLSQKAEGKSLEDARNWVRKRYHNLIAKRWHQVTADELLEMYLSSLTTAYDPHTTYMSPSQYDNFMIQMRLQLDGGIGAKLQADDDGTAKVAEVVRGGPADKAGELKTGDKISAVAQGEDGEFVEVVDLRLNDIVMMIRGKPGTTVRLKVTPNGTQEVKIYKITRDRVELTDAEAHGEVFEIGKKADGSAYQVGFIELPSFYMDLQGAREGKPDFKSTTRDVRKILDEFRTNAVDAVVLDLRENGGGSLSEAINCTGLFIDEGPVVQVKDFDGQVRPYDDEERGTAWEGPLVVVTSKLSASASEIFAGAIQDYGRGVVVGDKTTHGKGTVQTLLDLTSVLQFQKFGALKLTIQQFYRPSGDSTQERGVLADVELPSIYTHLDIGEADLDYALKFDRVAAVEFKKLHNVSPAIVEKLRQESGNRLNASKDFQKVVADVARYEESKQKPISLNEKKFMEQRGDSDMKDPLEEPTPKAPGIKRTFYVEEVLAITADYARLLAEQGAN